MLRSSFYILQYIVDLFLKNSRSRKKDKSKLECKGKVFCVYLSPLGISTFHWIPGDNMHLEGRILRTTVQIIPRGIVPPLLLY